MRLDGRHPLEGVAREADASVDGKEATTPSMQMRPCLSSASRSQLMSYDSARLSGSKTVSLTLYLPIRSSTLLAPMAGATRAAERCATTGAAPAKAAEDEVRALATDSIIKMR